MHLCSVNKKKSRTRFDTCKSPKLLICILISCVYVWGGALSGWGQFT